MVAIADMMAVILSIASLAPPASVWGEVDETSPKRPNTGRWVGALWCGGRLVTADRFTSKSRARKWANRSRHAYGAGAVTVTPYRARRWRRMSRQETKVLHASNIAMANIHHLHL